MFFSLVYEKKIRLYNSEAGFVDHPLESTLGHVGLRLFGLLNRSCFERSLHAMKIFEGIHNTVGEVLATII
jgi:hypothetical protein